MPVPATLRWMTTPLPKSSCSWPPLSGGSVRDAARMTTMLSSGAQQQRFACHKQYIVTAGLSWLPTGRT